MSPQTIALRYPFVKDCFAKEKQLNVIKNDMNYYYSRLNDGDGNSLKKLLKEREEIYAVSGCKNVVLQKIEADNKAILDKYSNTAKERIELDSNQIKKVYIAIATVTLLVSSLIIYKYRK